MFRSIFSVYEAGIIDRFFFPFSLPDTSNPPKRLLIYLTQVCIIVFLTTLKSISLPILVISLFISLHLSFLKITTN